MDKHTNISSGRTRRSFPSLNNKIAKMGGLAEQVLGQSIEALERRDPELAAADHQGGRGDRRTRSARSRSRRSS